MLCLLFLSDRNNENLRRTTEMVIGLGALLMLVGIVWMIYLAVTTETTTGGKDRSYDLLFYEESGPCAVGVHVDRGLILRLRDIFDRESGNAASTIA